MQGGEMRPLFLWLVVLLDGALWLAIGGALIMLLLDHEWSSFGHTILELAAIMFALGFMLTEFGHR
jgi:hypothetical protein